jgi:hypothetical protein
MKNEYTLNKTITVYKSEKYPNVWTALKMPLENKLRTYDDVAGNLSQRKQKYRDYDERF